MQDTFIPNTYSRERGRQKERGAILRRWRSSTGELCKLAGWRWVPVRQGKRQRNTGVSGAMWGMPVWHHLTSQVLVCVGGCMVVCERATETEASCISSASKSMQWSIDSHLQQNKNHTAHGWTYTHWFTLKTLCTENDVNIIVTWWLSNESGLKLSWTGRKRDVLESFQAFEIPSLSSFFPPLPAARCRSWWSVMLGHLGQRN